MGINDRVLDEIRRLCDSYSILVISGRRLIRVRCPFRVRILGNILSWKEGDVVFVDKVMVTRDLLMIYVIAENGYPSYLFQILLN